MHIWNNFIIILCTLSKLVEWVAAAQLLNHIHNNGVPPIWLFHWESSSFYHKWYSSISCGYRLLLTYLLTASSGGLMFASLLWGGLSAISMTATKRLWLAPYSLHSLAQTVFGFPQGSVVGPLFFNSIQPLWPRSSVNRRVFFADDTQLLAKI